jgi:ATP-binding cassette, subfamily B, multidrug efflux pump
MMRDGKIVERGTHEELLARHGAYHELYYAQFVGVAMDPEPVRRQSVAGA